MGAVWSGEIVKPLPFGQLGFQIDVTLAGQELVKLLLIGAM